MSFTKQSLKHFKAPKNDYSLCVAFDHLDKLSPQEAVEVAAFIHCKSNFNYTAAEICEALGHSDPELIREVEQKRSDQVSKAMASDQKDEEEEEVIDYSPVNLSDIDNNDILSRYWARHSFEKRTELFTGTDEELADLFIRLIGEDNCRYLPETGNGWIVWAGSYWERKPFDGPIRQLLRQLVKVLQFDRQYIASTERSRPGWQAQIIQVRCPGVSKDTAAKLAKAELTALNKSILKLRQAGGQRSIMDLIGAKLWIPQSNLDKNVGEIVFSNTTYRPRDNTFYAPQRSSFATRSVGIDWEVPTQEARDKWKDHLKDLEFDDATLEFLKRSFGYAALGYASEKRFWWFRGEKNTGKTTLIMLIATCLGAYGQRSQTKLWLRKSSAAMGHTDTVANLQGARLVYADEFPMKGGFDEEMLKQVTSGGLDLSASRKGQSEFQFKPTCALFCSSNFDPYINTADEAAVYRFTSLTFHKTVKPDAKYNESFLKTPYMKQAILEWVMEGARAYELYGLGEEPELVKKSRDAYLSDQVRLEDQLQEILCKPDPAPEKPLKNSDIVKALRKYQQGAGGTEPSAIVLRRAIEKEFKIVPDKSSVMIWRELSLKTYKEITKDYQGREDKYYDDQYQKQDDEEMPF